MKNTFHIPYLSFVLLSSCFIAFTVMALLGNVPYWVWFIPIGIGIMTTLTIFQGIILPQKTVSRGMELIQSQDYNNRLVKVGEYNSDKIVSLFNSLIDKLRDERLQNREQESLLSLLIEASPMGVVMLDFEKRISLANKTFLKIIGISKIEDILNLPLQELNNDIIPEILKVPLGKSEVIRKGNFRIYRIYHLSFIQEGFRREFYLLESMTDEIMKAEKIAYEKIIRTISHEVNNSIGGVRSVLEIVASHTDDNDIKKVVESCDRRCENMGNFIRDYAEVVKLPEPNLKKIDLNRELIAMSDFLLRLLPENVELRFVESQSPMYIKADATLLQQVILNIIKNAVESIQGKGLIVIEISKLDNRVNLTISNNGLPIDDKITTQLFTPFFTTKPAGKGIGLTLTRDILTRHGAEYSLFTGDDGITRFNIKFPKL